MPEQTTTTLRTTVREEQPDGACPWVVALVHPTDPLTRRVLYAAATEAEALDVAGVIERAAALGASVAATGEF